MYEKVFSRGRIGGCITRNRVILSPMDDCLGQASGEVSQRGIEYYAAKAKGGSGLVIVGYVGVIGPELGGVAMSGQTFLKSLDDRHAMSILCDRVHEYGGRVFIQLNHPGRKTTRAFNKGYVITPGQTVLRFTVPTPICSISFSILPEMPVPMNTAVPWKTAAALW